MTQTNEYQKTNAWIVVDAGLALDTALAPYILTLKGARTLYQAIAENDWVLVIDAKADITRVGRLQRIRSDQETTTLYFEKILSLKPIIALSVTSLSSPSGGVGRVQWASFTEALQKALQKTIGDIQSIKNQAYLRELLQLAVMDDLLGPAGGPHERILDMGVRDRYLVGKLAPREGAQGGIEGLEGPLVGDEAEELIEAKVPGQHEPGAEFGTTTGRIEPEADASDEIDAASNQSLVPSSLGLTFCVDGEAKEIEVEARWGRYERSSEHEIFRTRKNKETGVEEQSKAKVWQRIPCGGKLVLPLTEGVIPHQAPDKEYPEVRVQGSIRAKNANGDRLVTLFLVNAQTEPETNRDAAWVFQPELLIRAAKDAAKKCHIQTSATARYEWNGS